MSDVELLCDFCSIGYHAPFERFEKIATIVDGPAFLMRCKTCGSLWHETLRSAQHVSIAKALDLYPSAKL